MAPSRASWGHACFGVRLNVLLGNLVPGDGLLDGFHHGTTLALDMPVKQLKKRSTPTTTPRVHRPVVFASILPRQPSEPWTETSAVMFTLVRLLSAGAEAEDERWKVCWGGSCRLV